MRDEEKSIEQLIDELAAVRQELNSQQAMSDLIISTVPAGVSFLDRNLVYRWMNPQAEAIFHRLGLSDDGIIGRPLCEVFPEALDEGVVFRQALEAGTPVEGKRQAVVRCNHLVEVTAYWDFTCVPLLESGRFAGMLIFNQEVTDRVEMEALQKRRIADLQDVERLKGNFLNAASHELRTPLTSIMAYAEFLEDRIGGPLTDMQSEFLAHIRDGASRLQQLVDELIDFSRLEAGTLPLYVQPTNLAELLHEELERVHARADLAGLRLETTLDPGDSVVAADPMRIGQVISHLLDNALKFTPPGGTIRLTLRRAEGLARVEIADTGIGIPEESLDHLFTKFFQVDPSMTRAYGGAGLGLSICKAIVLAHGGTIGVTSAVGKGSTFWFALPLASPQTGSRLLDTGERGA